MNKLEIKRCIKKLELQVDVVNHKMSDVILSKSQTYAAELQRVNDFKCLLEHSYQTCVDARSSLFMIEDLFLLKAMSLIRKQVRKANLVRIYKSAIMLKALVSRKSKIIEMINVS